MAKDVPRRQLILLRHAKAERDAATDHERPLSERGRRDATEAGRRLRDAGLRPDLAVVSTSTRTRQTWQLVAAELGAQTPARFERAVYDNQVGGLLQLVRETSDDVVSLLLVGHNPSVEELAGRLDDGSGDTAARRAIAAGFPTSAFAVLSHGGSWRLVDFGRLRVEAFGGRER